MSAIRRGALLLARFRASSLGFKLATVGALLACSVIGGTFLVLRVNTERSVRAVFVSELTASQHTLRSIEHANRQMLLQSASLHASSPTLRAAVAAWRNDGAAGGSPEQRLRTLRDAAAATYAGAVDVDLLVITDDSGLVIATAGTVPGPPVGSSLESLPAMRSALYDSTTVPDSAFGVLRAGANPVECVVVPLLVGDFPVGALLLAKRISRLVPPDPSIAIAQVVASNHVVLSSTLPQVHAAAPWRPRWVSNATTAPTLLIAGSEYITATLPLGLGQDGELVQLFLVRSLAVVLDPIEQSLRERFLIAGVLAVLLVGAGGAMLSRSTLQPLARFVNFIQSGTGTDGFARFNEAHAPPEITALTTAYNRLIASLRTGHEDLQQRTVDLAKANHHLNRQVQRREQAEQALRESEDQLRQAQKLEALGSLAGGVAHDFNNILSIILGYAEIVQGELPPESPQRADVGKISDAAGRARTLVRQLLAFSRKQVLQPQLVDFNRIVSDVRPLLRPLIGEQVTLEVSLDADLSRVMADPGQIEQVIINLAVNARDAMPTGGQLLIETANVTLDAQSGHHPMKGGPVVMLSVADTGIGMDTATRRRIFEPFFTTKPVGQGTGLGLATVYGIVRQSEGNITVFSEPGVGSTFRCYFPRAVNTEVTEAQAVIVPEPQHGGETILLAEDESELRDLMRRTLKSRGYTVLTAADGARALEVAAEHSGTIDLLLTDVVMPNLTGTDLAERLTRERPGLKVLFLSGYSADAIERHGMLTPESRFVQKPVSPEVLLRTVRDLLDAEFLSQVIA